MTIDLNLLQLFNRWCIKQLYEKTKSVIIFVGKLICLVYFYINIIISVIESLL